MESRNKNRETIISNMCYTWRHDFGLLDPEDKTVLWNGMAQVFDNDIAPLLNLPNSPGLCDND